MKSTPLYDIHVEAGAKMIDFGGWMMPVQYTSIVDEHMAVRDAAGVFDVSHMGEILIHGSDAESFLQKILTNDISKIKPYQILYSPICYPDGGVIDDVLVYKFSEDRFIVVANAANTYKDYEWFSKHREGNVEILDVSEKYALLAVQGPNAEGILEKLTDYDLTKLRFFRFIDDIAIAGVEATISRTGYTGEDGFEIYVSPEYIVELWQSIISAGEEFDLIPAGLGARDTLRFEAALPLYGHEISESISPLEGGLEKFVSFKKGNFIGKDALKSQKEKGIDRKLVGFEMLDRGIAREGYEILVDGENIGYVTSGSYSPSLKKNLGMALIRTEYTRLDEEIDVVVRNRSLKAKLVELPFYRKAYKDN